MSGSRTAVMAWRNLWRNRRRTVVTLSSIAFGVLLAIIMTGMGDALYPEMIGLAARLGTGHVTLQHPEQLDQPSLGRTLARAETLRQRALAEPGVVRATTRITGQAMLATAIESTGALFMAIDPATEDRETMAVFASSIEGRFLERRDERGIVLGKRLAENLNLRLGHKVVYTMTDKEGEIVSGLARVRGIASTGVPSLDARLCLLPIDTVRRTLGYGADEATTVAVFISDQRDSDRLAARLDAAVGPAAAALPWHELQPELAGFVTMKVSAATFMELVLLVLIAAGIFNTLFVSVMERLREFGILRALGFRPMRLFRLVVWESVWLALVGLVVGGVVTLLPYYLLSQGVSMSAMTGGGSAELSGVALPSAITVAIFPESLLFIVIAVVAATVLAGLYPAWRAGRVVPVDAIKLG